ncbi:unnamed protein product [Pylaiella littoralis]
MGLPCKVSTRNILNFMGATLDEEDERNRFFLTREFSMIFGDRGEVSSSSVYSSCGLILSILHFTTFVLGRPCSLESVVLPLTVDERGFLQKLGCPPQYLDGPVKRFGTNWMEVFRAVDQHLIYDRAEYVTLDLATRGRYVEGLYVADVYSVYKATMSAPGDYASIKTLVDAYQAGSKSSVDTSAIVGVFDVIRDKSSQVICRLDERDLASIFMSYGERAYQSVQKQCQQPDSSTFDTCVASKVEEMVSYFDHQHRAMRARHKMRVTARATIDPAGINKKVSGQRMLDPRDPASKAKMMHMLKKLGTQVWQPIRSLMESYDPRLSHASTFLQISEQEAAELYNHVERAGLTYTDIANLYIILILSFSFQRSQVIRQSMVDEFVLVPDQSRYRLSFKRRVFKTATSTGKGSLRPVSHFDTTTEQSMIVKFIHSIGHRFVGLKEFAPTRRLLLNSNAQGWTQHDISSRFKHIGKQWLGLSNFGVHNCRTFWSTDALRSGAVNADNIAEFSSFLQVSRQTMENSYMSSTANSAAHVVGSQALGAISNAVCTGSTSAKGVRPVGKKLGRLRNSVAGYIRASLRNYPSPKAMFRALVQQRRDGTLPARDSWFGWDVTYFDDTDERFFLRMMAKLVQK